MQMNSVKSKKKKWISLKVHRRIKTYSSSGFTLCINFMSTLRLLCVFSKSARANSGQTPSSPRKKNSGFSLGLLSVGLGLIGTVSKRLILAGITLMKNPTNNIILIMYKIISILLLKLILPVIPGIFFRSAFILCEHSRYLWFSRGELCVCSRTPGVRQQ